nr:hypothetical protein [Tanacetum cinerariifolium]
MDREVKQLRQSRIPIIKVRWNSKRGPEYTWERKEEIRAKYPHLVNLEFTIKAVQDQLQRELELQISMSKAFRAKAKAEREIRGDHVLQYFILRDYIVELQSTNPNTTVKIAVERNTDQSLPTRMFQRIYVCLGALKLAVGLDSNNGIYPLAYVLVEVESKSSWCEFLQCLGDDIDLLSNLNFTFISDRQKCLGDDIDLHPNLNFTFISDRKKGIIPAIKTVFSSAKHRYCLRHIYENIKQRWCRAKSDLLLNNICEAFNGKIVRGGTTPRSLGKPLLLVDYIEGNILSQGTTNLWDQVLREVYMSNNTFATNASCPGGNNAKASGSTSRKPQQVKPAVGQDGLSGSGFGVVIGLSVADGAGGESGTSVGVDSQGSSHSRWTKRRVPTERISPQNRTHTQPASQPSTNSQVLVSETRNADGREMGDGIPTQSSVEKRQKQYEVSKPLLRFLILEKFIDISKTTRHYPSINIDITLQISPHLPEYQLFYGAWPFKQYQQDLVGGLGGGGYLRDYVRVVAGIDDRVYTSLK